MLSPIAPKRLCVCSIYAVGLVIHQTDIWKDRVFFRLGYRDRASVCGGVELGSVSRVWQYRNRIWSEGRKGSGFGAVASFDVLWFHYLYCYDII